MADRQFVIGGTVSAPADWSLPDTLDLRPKTAYASFDGSAAAGAFVPTLRIISDSGHVEGEYPCATALAAGASADVTWFPGVAGQVSGGGLSNPGLMGAQVQLAGDYAVTKGDPGTVIVWSATTFDTGSPTPFWSNANPKRLTAPVDGTYLSLMNLIWDVGSGTITDGQHATYLYHNTETITLTGSFRKQNTLTVGSASFLFDGASHGPFQLSAGDYLIVNAYENDPSDPAGTTHLMDLRTHVGQPPLFSSWSLVLIAKT